MYNLLYLTLICTTVLYVLFDNTSPLLNWKSWASTIYANISYLIILGLIYYIYGTLDESAMIVGWIGFVLGCPFEFFRTLEDAT